MSRILKTSKLPFCKGCGHGLIAKNTAAALENMGLDPLDVIIVTDIGCHGIIDKCLSTHTVHGLHGRSVAIGAGIAMGIGNTDKKIVVFIGDGGSTIGLQHILEAARMNINMTVVIHNNMLYGMTGGQTSGLTPCGFKTSTSAEGNPRHGYDICALSHTAGASYVSRVAGIGDISSDLEKALSSGGFSLVEVMEICPGYGVKLNPKRKLTEIIESSGKSTGEWINGRDTFKLSQGSKFTSLFDELDFITPDFSSGLGRTVSLVISGSAGEGVQLAANLLSISFIRSGCHVTQKGSYPVTVGVGFSTSEIVASPWPVSSHVIDVPDIVIVTSSDGLAHCKKRIENMERGMLFIDSGLDIPETGAEVRRYDFRSIGSRAACLYALFRFSEATGYVTPVALQQTVIDKGFSEKVPLRRIIELVSGKQK